jgi:hypothetical protein
MSLLLAEGLIYPGKKYISNGVRNGLIEGWFGTKGGRDRPQTGIPVNSYGGLFLLHKLRQNAVMVVRQDKRASRYDFCIRLLIHHLRSGSAPAGDANGCRHLGL